MFEGRLEIEEATWQQVMQESCQRHHVEPPGSIKQQIVCGIAFRISPFIVSHAAELHPLLLAGLLTLLHTLEEVLRWSR